MTGRMIWHPGYGNEGAERVNVTVVDDGSTRREPQAVNVTVIDDKKPKRPQRQLLRAYIELPDGTFVKNPEVIAREHAEFVEVFAPPAFERQEEAN